MENQSANQNKTLMEYFNRRPRIGILSTSAINGQVNAAIINSTRMIDPTTIELDVGESRSLENLRQNPQAVFMITQEGQDLMSWKGLRAYMKVREILIEGPKLQASKANLEKRLGKAAADSIAATVVFDITEIRPLVDRDQGWEKSIV